MQFSDSEFFIEILINKLFLIPLASISLHAVKTLEGHQETMHLFQGVNLNILIILTSAH